MIVPINAIAARNEHNRIKSGERGDIGASATEAVVATGINAVGLVPIGDAIVGKVSASSSNGTSVSVPIAQDYSDVGRYWEYKIGRSATCKKPR
mgnify:CR=1 FL=1